MPHVTPIILLLGQNAEIHLNERVNKISPWLCNFKIMDGARIRFVPSVCFTYLYVVGTTEGVPESF